MKAKRMHLRRASRDGVTRRDLLKSTGAAVAAATGAGLGLFGGKAPAFAQARELHYLEWSSFVKEADKEVERQAEEFGKMEGIKVRVEHINNNDLPTRAAAATESGVGPDVIQIWNQFPKLYADKLVNLSDLVEAAGGSKIYKVYRDATYINGQCVGVPYFSTAAAFAYRTDFFQRAGAKAPDTWEDFLREGAKIKKIGFPVGQALGHSFGDPPGFCYALLWGFGGKPADEKGKVAIDSKETRAALQFMREFWSAACDESGLAWDDTSNNRAYAAGTVATTRNGASIYFVAKRELKLNGNPLANVTEHFIDPAGPAGRRTALTQYNRIVFKHSKVQTAARNWIKFCLQKDNYAKFMAVNGGYANGYSDTSNDQPVWNEDPKLKPFKDIPKFAVPQGWPAPFDRRASEAEAKYIIVDMFARAVQGESVDAAIKFAESELKLIYT
jgi:multiple sugar transport system substrate-binding protein